MIRPSLPAADAGEQREFTVEIQDARGELLAGLGGWTWGKSAGIAKISVREDDRRSGHGARLLSAAKEVERGRGCKRINVSSFTFQAPAATRSTAIRRWGRTEALPVDGQADVHFVKHLV